MPSLFGRSSTKKDKSISAASPSKGTFHVTSGKKVPLGSQSPFNGRAGKEKEKAVGMGEFGVMPKSTSARTLPARSRPSMPLTPPDSPTSFSSSLAAPILPPKYTFLPTSIPARTSSDNSIDSFSYSSPDITGLRPYGFLGGVGSKVVLGLEDVGNVVEVVGDEIIKRALTTPLLFSNQALEANQTRTKMLIHAFLDSLTPSSPTGASRSEQFTQDLRFAREHELAWLLRWALSRITRIREGTRQVCHGMIEWEVYEEWRGRERAASYPADAFPFLSSLVHGTAYNLVIRPLFNLLSRLAAHSHLSGLTPHALSSLFAPLLFDVPGDLPALVAHAAWVRAACATEHLLLAYIRSTGSTTPGDVGLGSLPARLRDWVKGYPSMVASDADLARASPRKGAKVVRCERAVRTVRAYSKDLLMGAEGWGKEVKWEAFDRIRREEKRGEGSTPKFTPAYRKRMCVPETPAPLGGQGGGEMEYGLARLSGTSAKAGREGERKDEEGIWGSLAGKEWSMFEAGGFGMEEGEDEMRQKLRFDLNESAKQTIASKRKSVDWTEFASPTGGFNRTEPLLVVSLGFSQPVTEEITSWPEHKTELQRRLQKAQKEAVPFHYDTSIRIGLAAPWEAGQGQRDDAGRVLMEEGFLDCYADLMMGAGWIDRGELSFREANWAIVEYKAKPRTAEEVHPRDDPRTSEVYFLFEERVPLYQLAISAPSQKSKWGLFTPRRKRQPDPLSPPSTTLGGWGENEFDRMLLHRSATKRITLSPEGGKASVWHLAPAPSSPTKPKAAKRDSSSAEKTPTPLAESKSIFFAKSAGGRGRTICRVKSNENTKEIVRSEKGQVRSQGGGQEVEFELASASGISSHDTPTPTGEAGPPKPRTVEKDDKWMNILVANGARRMDRQDALPPRSRALPAPPHPSGLPVSPHPPAERQAPPPPHTSQHATAEGYDHIDPYVPYSDPSSPSKRPALPMSSEQGHREPVEYLYGSEQDHGTTEEGYHSEVLSPSPQRLTRDTIHGIVDTYADDTDMSPRRGRDSRISIDSNLSSEGRRQSLELELARAQSAEHPLPPVPSVDVNTEGEGLEGEGLAPPGPIFDLTPGREPSPARYKHGEPLHFVGEEEEEEDEEEAPVIPPRRRWVS